jgi:hypothetical protein
MSRHAAIAIDINTPPGHVTSHKALTVTDQSLSDDFSLLCEQKKRHLALFLHKRGKFNFCVTSAYDQRTLTHIANGRLLTDGGYQ